MQLVNYRKGSIVKLKPIRPNNPVLKQFLKAGPEYLAGKSIEFAKERYWNMAMFCLNLASNHRLVKHQREAIRDATKHLKTYWMFDIVAIKRLVGRGDSWLLGKFIEFAGMEFWAAAKTVLVKLAELDTNPVEIEPERAVAKSKRPVNCA